jgi:hypothetical protein
MLANISISAAKVKATPVPVLETVESSKLAYGHQEPGGKRDKYKKGKQKIIQKRMARNMS